MQELDRNKAYDLSKLNETELQDVINWLGENKLDSQINLCNSEFIKEKISDGRYLHYYKDAYGDLLWGFRKTNKEPIDAKELFKELDRWYKYDDGYLFYITSECEGGHLYGYGFSKDSWVYNVDEKSTKCVLNSVAKNYKTPATKEEVEERLKQGAIKRGFNVGYESGKYVYFIHDKDWYYNDKSNTFFVRQDGDTWNMIMRDGVWAEIENEKLPPYKEAPLKWDYETLVGGNQVVIEHTKEFIPSKKQVLKYLLKRDIVLTPKQYKKLWKK